MKYIKQYEEFISEANLIPGGIANGMPLEDIAKKHGVDLAELEAEYEKGIKVEMEHTSDKNVAMEIARHHLLEDPKYYTILAKIEESDERVDLKDEDDRLMKIRHFQGSIQDLDDWLRSKVGETNPHKDVIMINGPQQGQKDKSLPYQDFQNGESDLVNNRYGRKDS